MSSVRTTALGLGDSLDVCGLLSIPQELRDMIYSELLRGGYTNLLDAAASAHAMDDKSDHAASQLNIFRTSPQLSEEALLVFYQENAFQLTVHGPHQVKVMRRMLNRQSSSKPDHVTTHQIQRVAVHINLDNDFFNAEAPCLSELPSNQLRKPGKSGVRSEQCDVKLNYCWWSGCCRFHLRYPPRETIRLLRKLSMFRTVMIEVRPVERGFSNHTEHLEFFEFPYPMLEKKLKAALGPGQPETAGTCRRLLFAPSSQAPAKVKHFADFAVKKMGSCNIWSSFSDPAEDSEFWE